MQSIEEVGAKGLVKGFPPIWLVSELYYPEETSTGHVLTRIAESLATRFAVKVLCGQPDYSGKPPPSAPFERRLGVEIHRCSIPHLNKNRVPTRIARAVFLTVGLFFKTVAKVGRDDVVIAVTNPFPLLLSIALACKIRGSRFLIFVHDVFPENTVAAGLLRPDSWMLKLLSRIMALPYAAAQGIVVNGRDMKELVARKGPGLSEKIAIITNWADSSEIRPMARSDNPLIKRLGLQERFVVQFAGNLGRVQGLDFVLKAADMLAAEPVQFLFIGAGARADLIAAKAAQGRHVTLLESQPRSEQPNFLNACDISIVSLAPGMYGLGVPSKTYNILAAGKPIIAMVDEDSEIGRLVREEGIGWVVAPGDADGLARAILEARSDRDRLILMGSRARILAETTYSFQRIAGAYSDLFARILSPEE